MTDEEMEARVLEICTKAGFDVPIDAECARKWMREELPLLIEGDRPA